MKIRLKNSDGNRMTEQIGQGFHGLFPHRRRVRDITVTLCALILSLLAIGCGPQVNAPADSQEAGALAGDSLRPVEEEQIDNVVTAYFSRDSAAPDYTVTVEEVEEGWARVTMSPLGVENSEPNIVYLQDQSDTAIEASTPDPEVNPGNIAPVETTSGWTIIAGPQVNFSEEELDSAGVPPFIREQ